MKNTLPASLPDSALPALRAALLAWYDAEHRPLPWRTEVSVYRTVVSEFMAQQTQIDTVLPYFDRWMRLFPSFEALAEASEEAVVKQWEGLGYYRRARNLHKLAKEVAAQAALPSTAADWQALSGIGPYTAAAIASINFAEPIPVIDGNVIRVLSRLTANPTLWKSSQQAQKELGPLATRLLDPQRPGDYNQAVMELGATRCRKARPDCLLCPLRTWCAAYAEGAPEAYPRVQRKATEKVTIDRAWAVQEGKLLLERGATDSVRLADMFELPRLADLPKGAKQGALHFQKQRGISNQRITERVYRVTLPVETALNGHLVWVSAEELERLALSGPHRRWIGEYWGK
ncbi:MAG: A/G-specific adenine glycosylase [Verrucomicrobiota bacterium JB022]|nr:A/G-specific adenine glycosylase [Verrucomicrobiota bacterium JB022]